ncbi:glycosyltransferase [Xylanimonas sp. McL0601]|uniref:glycosyltransferase n=1 Tax=Xylanimonas sp. McL0601 TaxID=3414739 RepID=UPI003CFAF108
MRVLCSFVGGAGHLVPQIPLHVALAEAGHELMLVGRESAATVAPAGVYTRIATRPDRRTQLADTVAPLTPVDIEHELSVIERYFAGEAAHRSAAAMRDELAGVDLVVCDEVDFGAMAAAQRAGVPVAVVAVIASGALVRPDRLVGALEALRLRLGVPAPIRPRGDCFVVPFAPAMRDPRFPAPGDALWMRPEPGPAPRTEPYVVATLGTEFNTESGDLFDRILTALATAGTPATVAVGRDLDPASFGPQPSHVQVEQYVDLDAALPRADIVLHHGGSGLFVRSVLSGAAQIVFPMGADHPFTAERVRDLGLGQVLDPITATPATIAHTITSVRADRSTRRRAEALRLATLALPAPFAIVERLEAIAQGAATTR